MKTLIKRYKTIVHGREVEAEVFERNQSLEVKLFHQDMIAPLVIQVAGMAELRTIFWALADVLHQMQTEGKEE